jgi:hypothetical protein
MRTTNQRRLISLMGVTALTFAGAPTRGLTQVPYPGTDPGPARILQEDGLIMLSNAVMTASWRAGKPGLSLQSVRAAANQTEFPFTGETFAIVVSNGQRYAASDFQAAGPPTVSQLVPVPQAARLAERIPGRQVTFSLRSADGRLRVRWQAMLRDGGNYVRQEIAITPEQEDCAIQEIVWMNQAIPNAPVMGQVDGSPVVMGNFFLGPEDPHARSTWTAGGGTLVCRVPRNALLRIGETLTQSFVLGVAPAGQMRRGFLGYLERERAHPFRPYLHYNSWYDTAWNPFALNETNCLAAIALCGERLIRPHGVVMDGMVFDDGWDDPKTLWQFHGGFPAGFAPLAASCRQYHTRLGVLLSPFGGYGGPKEQRLKFGREQGYEINAAGFSLAGPKYYAAFKAACVGMIRNYGVNHFKFDGIATGMYARGSGQYLLDTEAMRRLMLELRREDPDLYINLTTGSWPSPFWLRFADSLWRQGGDMGLAGKGTRQQQWLTYRDQEVYRNVVVKGPLYPLNALMTQGVAYSRHGSAGDPTFTAAGFKEDVRAFFGSGTGLQELYVQPDKLTTNDWAVLAEAAKWSRANADVLVDTHWIGGDPSRLEIYGYASWSKRKGLIMLRNPDDRPHVFALEIGMALELPAGSPRRFLLKSPWAEDAGQPPLTAEVSQPLPLTLQPFQIMNLEVLP